MRPRALGAACVVGWIALGVWSCVGDEAATTNIPSSDAGATPASGNDAGSPPAEAAAPVVDATIPGDGGCNPSMPFVSAASLGIEVNTNQDELSPRLTGDELVMYFTRAAGAGTLAARRVTRSSMESPWGASTVFDNDGLTQHIYVWTSVDERQAIYSQLSAAGDWEISAAGLLDAGAVNPPTAHYVTELNSPLNELEPYASVDQSEIWFESNRSSSNPNYFDIFSALKLADGGYGPPRPATKLNTTANEASPVLSADKLTLYFGTTSGRSSGSAVWLATRASANDEFSNPVAVKGLESLEDQANHGSAVPGWISLDDCRLYLTTTKDDGSQDLYVASRR